MCVAASAHVKKVEAPSFPQWWQNDAPNSTTTYEAKHKHPSSLWKMMRQTITTWDNCATIKKCFLLTLGNSMQSLDQVTPWLSLADH